MAISLAKGERLALGPIYLGSLYIRLDECVNNIFCSVGTYEIIRRLTSAFYRFEGIAPNQVEFSTVEW